MCPLHAPLIQRCQWMLDQLEMKLPENCRLVTGQTVHLRLDAATCRGVTRSCVPIPDQAPARLIVPPYE